MRNQFHPEYLSGQIARFVNSLRHDKAGRESLHFKNMRRSQFMIDRRSFLTTATPFALSLPGLARAQRLMERGRFDDEQLPLAREQLLNQLNAERSSAGLNELKLDDLACTVANQHARDMATSGFLSHWGSDGRKPYHRYSLAGG